MASPRTNRDVDTTTASARLPGLDIDIIHSRSPDGDSEQVSITLKAVPSFQAFGRALEAANPFAFWATTMRLAWLPWLEAARSVMQPPSLPAPKSVSKAASHSVDERD
jgi:hypothetical protein